MGKNLNTMSGAEVESIQEIQHQAYSQKELAQLVQGTVNIANDRWSDLEATQHHSQALYVAERRVANMETIMTAALNKQISPAIFNDVDINKTAQMIDQYANDNNMVPVAHFFTDFLQMEASFVASDDGYKIYLHVPLMGKSSGMHIYKHSRLPIPLADGFHALIEGPNSYLAVDGPGTLFKAMTADDLANCRRMGEHYVCERGNVVRRAPAAHVTNFYKDPELCLWALFNEKYTIASATCDISVNIATNSVIQLSANKFAMYTADPHQGKIHCRNTSTSFPRNFQLNKLSTITLPAGCTARTNSHVFAAADTACTRPAEDWAVGYKWAFDHVKSLTRGLDTDRKSVV
jgi:hypothetical protein